MRFSWLVFASALLAAGEAAAQAGEAAPGYGYGARDGRERPALDFRRSSPPQASALTVAADDILDPDEEAAEGPVLAEAAQGRLAPEPGFEETGTASWYGAELAGRPTASGEIFNPDAMTAAHPTFPLPSLIEVTNLDNGRSVVVRVNDRGPFTRGRSLDVSRGAADQLGFVRDGEARVRVRYLGPAPRAILADAGEPVLLGGPVDAPETPLADAEPYFTPAAAFSPAASPPPAAAAVQGGFVVQVGAFADLMNAQRVREHLLVTGPVLIEPRRVNGGEVYRVRVGPLADRREAESMRLRVAALGYPDAIVQPR